MGEFERMLAMPEVNYIKHLRDNEDLTINEIAKKTGRNWRTIKRYADGDVPLERLPSTNRGMMYEEGYGEIVDIWLEEDMKLKHKERRTSKRMFEQLRDEHDFKGSYRTVCEYVQYRRPVLKAEKATRYERLEHPPGEAQVDFGQMTVVKDGAYKDLKILIMSFPFSNAGFAYPLPAENSECFLEGLKQLFKQAGGVPTHLRIDNLSAAVISIGKGDKRTYTDSFLRFQAHYGFEVQACNPSSGHEKGNVEKKVGYTRNNLFVTAPEMEDFPQLATWLQMKMQEDMNRPHYEKSVLIKDLFEEDRRLLKVLPIRDLEIYSLGESTLNKYGEITVDGEKFVIHKGKIKHSLVIKKEWNTFTCFTNDGEIVYQDFRAYMHNTRAIPWLDIFDDWTRKPRAVKYSRFYKYLPERVRVYLTIKPEEIKQRLKGFKALLEKHSLEEIQLALETENRFERMPHELGYLIEAKKASYPEKMPESHTPSILNDYQTDLHTYDRKLIPQLEGRVSQ